MYLDEYDSVFTPIGPEEMDADWWKEELKYKSIDELRELYNHYEAGKNQPKTQ